MPDRECICGASISVSGPANVQWEVLSAFDSTHRGEGHGRPMEMQAERAELAGVISAAIYEAGILTVPAGVNVEVADAVIASGWRRDNTRFDRAMEGGDTTP